MNTILKLFIPFSAVVFSACAQSGDTMEKPADKPGYVEIQGKINHPAEEGYVLLESIGNDDISLVDTLMVSSDSSFRYSLKNDSPGFYRLNLYDRQYVNLILNDEDVQIVADGNSPDGLVKVTGSKDTDYFYLVNDIMRDFQEKVNAMNADFMKAQADDDAEAMKAVEEKYLELEKQNTEKLKDTIDQMGTSIAAFYAVNFLDAEKEFEYLSTLADRFQENLPDSRYTRQFVAQVEDMRKLAVGNTAPEIALPNPAGDTVMLSSLRGNYVMIDFWAAWCKPCRMENPNVVRMYNKYKDQGFEIYGVSLDRTREDWLEAIKDDNLTWTHVSDLSYFDSEAARLYNINAIPATVLLDKEGKIIAKNLRGAELEAKLAEIFGDA
ncbi:MAG: redoxin domain-containing protein [Cyclobacteriaceae bacterium]